MKRFTLSMLPLLCLFTFTVSAQGILDEPVPMDPAIRTGKLANGLTYFIRHNEEPKDRVSFYMIQNVGALLENDKQNGLAHFLEHMSFNGTENYPGKGFLDYLEKNGVAFGRNINAYTSFNETVYNLSDVPSTRQGLVDSCLLVLHDWSDYLLLTDEEIDAERGVISEEWRTRRNASFRMRNKWFPVVFEGSKWAIRDVIGSLDVIQHHDYETLRSFYHDWYRTDLQGIAIVGDIDVDKIEAKVKEMFSEIKAVENPKPRPDFKIPDHDSTRFVLATDKEATNSSIRLFILHEATPKADKNMKYLREDYVSDLINQMARERISELLQKGNPPFINGGISIGGFVRGYDAAVITVTANPNNEDEGLKAIYTEEQRIIRHGFTEGELNRAKTNMLTSMESQYKQRDKISNDQYVRGIQYYFLEGEPLTSAEFDWEAGQKLLASVTLDDVNAMAKDMFVKKNRNIIITGPSEGATHLTKDETFKILADVESAEIAPYEDAAAAASLIEDELPGSEIVSTKNIDELGAEEWKLANNAVVVFKHADFEKDQVLLKAYSPGGSSLFDSDDLLAASMTGQFMNAFGVGDFDAIALRKMLTGKKASVNTGINDLTENINGGSTPKDFETMMQLLYLQFNNPRFDQEAYNALKSRYVAYLKNMANNPKKIMSDSLTLIATNHNERTKLMSASMFDEISFDQMEELYKDRFKDVDDFKFFIVGNIDKETAKEMVCKYIGSMKDLPGKENWTDNKVRMPKGKTERAIKIPLEIKKANSNIIIRKEMAYTPESNIELSILKAILRLRYTEEIREKEGGTYGVSVGNSSNQYPYERKTLQMTFDADHEKVDYLKTLIYKEIDKIVEDGPTQVDLTKVILNMKKERDQNKLHNNYWLGTLFNYYFHGYNSDAKENFDDILDSLTPEKIQKFAKDFYTGADIVDVTFIPEED